MQGVSGGGAALEWLWEGIRSLFGGGTRDEIGPLTATVRSDEFDPEESGIIPVEVRFQSNPSYLSGSETIFMGVEGAFDAVDDSGAGTAVKIADADRVATPDTVMDFENPHEHGKLMHFSLDDVVPPAQRGEVTLGVGAFPDGAHSRVPASNWDTDEVLIPPRGTAT